MKRRKWKPEQKALIVLEVATRRFARACVRSHSNDAASAIAALASCSSAKA